MFKQNHRNSKIKLLAILAALPLFAACGGEDGEGGSKSSKSSSGVSGGGLLCFTVVLVSGDDACVSSYISSSSGGSGSSGNSGSTGGSSGSGGSVTTQDTNDSIVYMDNYDFEPNNDWMNAYVLGILYTTSRDGFVVEGNVHDMSDPADTFSFSRNISRNFRFKLCAPAPWSCGEAGQIDTITAYIDVLDSSGNVIASSQAASSNVVETRIEAGLTYYVRVVAGDTMATTVSYNFYGHEND